MKNIIKIKKNLEKDGFVLIKQFFKSSKEFKNFKKYLLFFLNFSLKKKCKSLKEINENLTISFKKNNKISSFLNDNINLSPYLQNLLVSEKLIFLISNILKEKQEKIVLNNQRFRIQIPGNDEISNLPWHQDSHYNSYKKTKSVVAWISLVDVNKNMGPVIFKKGSHKFGEQKKIKIIKKNKGSAFKVDLSNKNLKKLKNTYLETKAGDLILIDLNCVHVSGQNSTTHFVKYSAQARYHIVKR